MSEAEDRISEDLEIDNIPLSSSAVRFLKSQNIKTIRDLRGLNLEGCRAKDEKLANEISVIIEPYLTAVSDNSSAPIQEVPLPEAAAQETPEKTSGDGYSALLGENLSCEELQRAARTPINSLDIARFHILIDELEKWGVKTVEDILKIKPEKLANIRGVGNRKIKKLSSAIKEVVFGDDRPDPKSLQTISASELLLGRRLTVQEKELLRDVSIESVLDDVRARNVFRKLKIKTVITAASLTRERFLAERNAGRLSLKKTAGAIEDIIRELGCREHDIQLNEEGIKHIAEEHILARLSDDQIMILKDRHGLWDGAGETLEDISHKFNVTRERVRQIQKKAEDSISRNVIARWFATRLMERFRVIAHEELQKNYEGLASSDDMESIVFKIDGDSLIADLAYKFLRDIFYPEVNPLAEGLILVGKNVLAWDSNVKKKFEKICGAAELALVSKGRPQLAEELTPVISKSISEKVSVMFLKRCLDSCPQIGLDETGKIGLKRWPHFYAQNMESMAHKALMELGAPSHYSYITEKMNILFPHRAPFSERSVLARMSNHPEIFVKAGRRGRYALVDWGIPNYPSIKDFLAQELRGAGQPLPEDELVSRGVAKYDYRESSIRMTLLLQKRTFKKLPDGKYVLNR